MGERSAEAPHNIIWEVGHHTLPLTIFKAEQQNNSLVLTGDSSVGFCWLIVGQRRQCCPENILWGSHEVAPVNGSRNRALFFDAAYLAKSPQT